MSIGEKTTAEESISLKKQSLKSVLGLALALMLGALLAIMMSSSGSLLESGTQAPGFALPAVDASHGEVSLQSLRGKVVLIDFWSTSCPPCIRQMRTLETIHRQMGEELVILGINSEGASPQTVHEFVQARGVRYPVLVDSGVVAESYRVDRLPTLYVVDRQGRIQWSRVGYTSEEELVEVIREHI